MTKYELMVILPGDMTEKEALTHLEEVKGYLTENGGKIEEELIWGKRDLAYSIKKQDVGFYAMYHFTMEDASGMSELKEELRLDQKVMRELIIKVPENYTYAQFEKEEAEAIKAKEEALAKRKHKGGPQSDRKKKEEAEAPKKAVASKAKSTSDTVLDDPDLKL